ncbi:hypothetical protein O3P69_011633 [Scylla paramamosain]|uniref:Integrase catalytic domain-containing protein n=1 Tax=Scylla paramamosain TaxID=85552 RepID=A0AAW0T6N2_SCYPA
MGYCATNCYAPHSINDELCKSCWIRRSITSAYHPQINGATERASKTLRTRLVKLCNEAMSNCPNFQEEVAYCICILRTPLDNDLNGSRNMTQEEMERLKTEVTHTRFLAEAEEQNSNTTNSDTEALWGE